MFAILKWLFGEKEKSNTTTFTNLDIGEEFKILYAKDQLRYVKISDSAYYELPVNNYTSLKWRLVTENITVSRA
jgi:hypothetical protein